MEWGDKMPIGILYRTAAREVFASRFRKAVSDQPLSELLPTGREEIAAFLLEFRPGRK
jgi:hypothetical protein